MSSETITKNDLKGVLDAVLPPSANIFHEETIAQSGMSGTTWYGVFHVPIPTVNGYTPVTVSRIYSNQANKTFYSWSINRSDNTLDVGIANTSASGTISSLTIGATVVYLRI